MFLAAVGRENVVILVDTFMRCLLAMYSFSTDCYSLFAFHVTSQHAV